MTTLALHRNDPYLRTCSAVVTAVHDDGVELDRTVFYPLGGGQAGDAGTLRLPDGSVVAVLDTRKSRREGATPDDSLHLLDPASGWRERLALGTVVQAEIDWSRRHRHMRDFAMTAPLEREAVQAGLDALIAAAQPVTREWITDAELLAQPQLVKSMSVSPPIGFGRVRLVRVADTDLQPCGGTHVANTREIGALRVAKIEKKSARTRRVVLEFAVPPT